MEVKDVFVETNNFMFGRVSFIYFKVPVDWRVSPLYYRTDVEEWIEKQGVKWATSGYTGVLLLKQGRETYFSLTIKASKSFKKRNVEKWLEKEKLKVKGGKVKHGYLNVCSHRAAFISYNAVRRKHGFFGGKINELIVKFFFICPETSRAIYLEFSTNNEAEKTLNDLNVLVSSIKCH